MPKFSIILPVRNGGTYVKECVQSILHQTYSDFNCIVLDNASSDGTYEWLKSLDEKRLSVIPSSSSLTIEQNWGRVKDVEKGEYMTMIGHDDIFSVHYLEEMNHLIERHPQASLYQTHFKYIDKDGKPTRNCLPMDERQYAHEFLGCQLNDTINSTGTGYMMRSADFNELGGMPAHYPNLIYADYELWMKLTAKRYKATALRECFYYREHLSVSRSTNGEQYLNAFEQYVHFMDRFRKTSPDVDYVITRYGYSFLLKYCEGLSHRLLKTPIDKRKLKVDELLAKFRQYAEILVPGEKFEPGDVKRIKYALMLDKSAVTRNLFNAVNNWIKKS